MTRQYLFHHSFIFPLNIDDVEEFRYRWGIIDHISGKDTSITIVRRIVEGIRSAVTRERWKRVLLVQITYPAFYLSIGRSTRSIRLSPHPQNLYQLGGQSLPFPSVLAREHRIFRLEETGGSSSIEINTSRFDN